MIAGLLEPESGVIELGGRTVFDKSARKNVAPHRRGIGVVFQENLLFPHYSVEGNLRYGQDRRGSATRRIRFEDVVELLKLGPLLRQAPARLSGGEQRRVALGRALLASPQLLLLDEPMTGLDEPLKVEILAFLQRVRDELKVPMVYVSHHLADILHLTRELWFLHDGRLLGRGDYLDLVQEPGVVSHLLPLGLLNVLDVQVVGHDEAAGCTRFAPRSTESGASTEQDLVIHGPLVRAAVGAPVSLMLRPEDIALSPAPVELISVRNQIRGRIRRHTEFQGRSIMELDVGLPLLVEISTGSYERLGLGEGREVWCLIKATALKTAGSTGFAMD